MLHLLCALKCEARPLIDYYQLKQVADADAFSCYINRDENITLTISFPGKINAAAATAYTYEYFKCSKSDGWLNIGIAGHRSLNIGRAVLANKIMDYGNGQTWYPQIIFTVPCVTQSLKTLDKPSVEYEESMYDMEATGYYSTASRFASSELIHVLKIISDNSTQPASKPDEIFFSSLIEQQLQTIDQLINLIFDLSTELANINGLPRYFDICIKKWHFSRYEKYTLARILNRWQILRPGEDPVAVVINASNSKELIALLEQKLDSAIIHF